MISKNPTEIYINNKCYKIRYDMWSILDIIKCLNDYELSNEEKYIVSLDIFYYDISKLNNYEKSSEKMNWFINCGNEQNSKSKETNCKLMDWEQDFALIKPPVNRILGYDICNKSIHWWTFISAYMEIFSNENSLFGNVLDIRKKIKKGKKLEKHERQFYYENKEIIDLKNPLTPEQKEEAKLLFGEV